MKWQGYSFAGLWMIENIMRASGVVNRKTSFLQNTQSFFGC